jgi:plasmid stability protein
MKRLQIMLDEDLDSELARRASAEGRSKASIIREALRQTLRPLPPLEEDPIWEMVGADPDGEPVDDVDEYLIGLKEARMREAK